MKRRNFLSGIAAATALPNPALTQPVSARTLSFAPQGYLTSLDPVFSKSLVTRNFAYLVYDTLYGIDDFLRPRPQMAMGQQIDEDGKRWTITLRSGLTFHDGTPVRAVDCAASIRRWLQRDDLGQTIASRLNAIETPADDTIVFRLKQPFVRLAWALGKSQPNAPVIMPERLANTNPFQEVAEAVGSGPYRYLAEESSPGKLAVFARYEQYKPREEAPSGTAGAKRALMDRVEWRFVADADTAIDDLKTGRLDWMEQPLAYQLKAIMSDRSLIVDRLDPFGLYSVLRFNCLRGPTASQGVRQAILAAINPVEVMQAVVGTARSAYNAPIGCFLPGTESTTNAAMYRLGGSRPIADIQRLLDAAGYANESVVLLHPTDQPYYAAMSKVILTTLQKIGVSVSNVRMSAEDVEKRRTSKEPLDQGGWSMFPAAFPALDYVDPVEAPALRGDGAGAWYGWPTIPSVEAARNAWMESTSFEIRQGLAANIQAAVLEAASFVPLGQYRPITAFNLRVTGHIQSPVPIFWNLHKT